MHILHRELCLPRIRMLIQQLLPSRDPTSVPRPAQVMHHVMTLRSLPLLEILLYLGQHLPLMPLPLYLDLLVCPLTPT